MDVLVIDVGGSHVKMRAAGSETPRRLKSGGGLTPPVLVDWVADAARDWNYDVISLGIPGPVHGNALTAEPGNLGEGWVDFDFARAFGKPVRLVNDAVMQALGAYDGGRMLFLGLGTGLGSALITEHVLVPLELGSLPHAGGRTLAERLGRAGLAVYGRAQWLQDVADATQVLRRAFAADYVMLGGGNAKHVDPLPDGTRRGGNEDAITGGFRLWEEIVEPHDRQPLTTWRVVR